MVAILFIYSLLVFAVYRLCVRLAIECLYNVITQRCLLCFIYIGLRHPIIDVTISLIVLVRYLTTIYGIRYRDINGTIYITMSEMQVITMFTVYLN